MKSEKEIKEVIKGHKRARRVTKDKWIKEMCNIRIKCLKWVLGD